MTASTGRRESRVQHALARVVNGLATPLVAADYLDLLAPLRHGAELVGRVVAIEQETADAVTVVLRPGHDWAGHVPGQYARVGVEVDGVRLWRTYSITSAPWAGDRRGAELTFTAKQVPGGAVSTAIAGLAVGDLVHLDQALGDFVVPDELRGGLLFVTAGSGITPVIGMLRSGLLDRDGVDVVVVHSDRTASDVIFGEELRALAEAGRITLIERHTAGDGRLSTADLVESVPDAHRREVYVCGPAGLVSTVELAWTAIGLADRVHTEVFHTPVVVTGDGGTVQLEKSGLQVRTEPGESVLTAAEAAGATLPFGCRQGLCFRCVLPLVEGSVRDLRTDEATHAAPGDGVSIQTCVSTAAGPCRIDG